MPGERQVAIVTGATSGIGRAMTLGLLEQGICVLGVDKEPVWLSELEEGRRQRGDRQPAYGPRLDRGDANVLVPGGMTDTRIVPDAAVADRSRLLRPEIMVPPLLWLVSEGAADVTGKRFLAVHWDSSLPPAEAAEKCGAPIAWRPIATMPIEPD